MLSEARGELSSGLKWKLQVPRPVKNVMEALPQKQQVCHPLYLYILEMSKVGRWVVTLPVRSPALRYSPYLPGDLPEAKWGSLVGTRNSSGWGPIAELL